jgi:hypothetical protein
VVLIVKFVFILKMVCFLCFLRHNIKQCTQLVEKIFDMSTHDVPSRFDHVIDFTQTCTYRMDLNMPR